MSCRYYPKLHLPTTRYLSLYFYRRAKLYKNFFIRATTCLPTSRPSSHRFTQQQHGRFTIFPWALPLDVILTGITLMFCCFLFLYISNQIVPIVFCLEQHARRRQWQGNKQSRPTHHHLHTPPHTTTCSLCDCLSQHMQRVTTAAVMGTKKPHVNTPISGNHNPQPKRNSRLPYTHSTQAAPHDLQEEFVRTSSGSRNGFSIKLFSKRPPSGSFSCLYTLSPIA